MALEVGIDEVGYGPKLGPLIVAAACAARPLRVPFRIADSKKVFSQSRGVRTLEPAVLGLFPADTFHDFLERLSAPAPDAPWYRASLPLPRLPRADGLDAAYLRFVEPAEFNAAVRRRNKSGFLFELVADLVGRIRRTHPGPLTFHIGKHGSRTFYAADMRRFVDPDVTIVEEGPACSTYAIPGARLSFLRDAEDAHELVALASMIGKYARERAMELLNGYWAARVPGLRRTAGYGRDGDRFFRDIEPALARLAIPREDVLRLR